MMRVRPILLALALIVGLGLGGNGLFMLAAPSRWYFAVPGVTTTGPFNQHFLRDIGLIFALISAAILTGIVRPANRAILWGASAFWLSGHALFHVWEVVVGICGPDALIRDFADVTVPALIVTGLALWAWRDGRRHLSH